MTTSSTKTLASRSSKAELPPSRGAIACRWIERYLVHGEGDFFGQRFRLRPWQKRFLYRLYEYDPAAGNRQHRRALWGLPKGQGKTELMAAVGLLELAGPFAPIAPNIPIAAASFEQADLLFGTARVMVDEGPLAPFIDTADTEMRLRDAPGRMFRVAAAAGTNDGGKPTCFIADELHEWTGAKARVHLVISNSLRKRANGLELNISTAGADRDTLLGHLYAYGRRVESGEIADPTFLFEWYEAGAHWDLDDPVQLRAAILEANPAAGDFWPIEDRIARYHDPEVEAHEYRRYFLNQWVSAPDRWIDDDSWDAAAAPKLPRRWRLHHGWPARGTEVVLGFDGSSMRDCTALIGCTNDGYVFVVEVWEPGGKPIPRRAVNAAVAKAMRRWKVRELACDPAGWNAEIEEWEQLYGDAVVRYEMASARVAPACSRFRAAVVDDTDTDVRKLRHDRSPLLRRHIANAHRRDTAHGVVIQKEHKDSPNKIDAAMAAVIAYDRAMHAPAGPSRKVWSF